MPKKCPRLSPQFAQISQPKLKSGLRGWHAVPGGAPPCRGKGSATVEPIRELHDISRIKGGLSHNPRDLSLFVVGIHAGLRASDLLSLRWSNILEEDGSVADKIVVRERKTGNSRHIALQEKVQQSLEQWLRHCGGPRVERSAFLWPNRDGGPLTVQRLHQLVNYWCSSIGLRGHFGTHTLRKTYGYHLRRLGYDVDLLMKIFGHSSASITLRYIGIEQEEIDEANLRLAL